MVGVADLDADLGIDEFQEITLFLLQLFMKGLDLFGGEAGVTVDFPLEGDLAVFIDVGECQGAFAHDSSRSKLRAGP